MNKTFFTALLSLALTVILATSCKNSSEEYVCPPCGQDCDAEVFAEPGNCPHCGMALLLKGSEIENNEVKYDLSGSEAEPAGGEIPREPGLGNFLFQSVAGRSDRTFRVYYNIPRNFSPQSKVLIVMPGAGRNARGYLESWLETSETYNVVVLTPEYTKGDYPFDRYHLGGVMRDINFKDVVTHTPGTPLAQLDEEGLEFTMHPVPGDWIFSDFDRLFDYASQALELEQETYDMFGHSAGGQILHRLAVFYPQSRVNNIIAANSGFYTLPDAEVGLPFGIREMGFGPEHLEQSFGKKLVLFNGSLDDENETKGTLLRSPTVDKQGVSRVDRGSYFMEQSERLARQAGFDFNWSRVTVPDVGHDQELMAKAAADYLYTNK